MPARKLLAGDFPYAAPQLRTVKEWMAGNANGRLSSVVILGETFKKARKTKGKGTRPTGLDF